jgi:hypothetical protein
MASTRIEAYGSKGLDNKAWRREFSSPAALARWAEANSATVIGTREAEPLPRYRAVSEPVPERSEAPPACASPAVFLTRTERGEFHLCEECDIRAGSSQIKLFSQRLAHGATCEGSAIGRTAPSSLAALRAQIRDDARYGG